MLSYKVAIDSLRNSTIKSKQPSERFLASLRCPLNLGMRVKQSQLRNSTRHRLLLRLSCLLIPENVALVISFLVNWSAASFNSLNPVLLSQAASQCIEAPPLQWWATQPWLDWLLPPIIKLGTCKMATVELFSNPLQLPCNNCNTSDPNPPEWSQPSRDSCYCGSTADCYFKVLFPKCSYKEKER